jgi:hypothetical protein
MECGSGTGAAQQAPSESKYYSSDDGNKDKQQHQPQRQNRSASSSISFPAGMIPMVDLGKDMCGIFPTTVEDMGIQGTPLFFPILRLWCGDQTVYISFSILRRCSRAPLVVVLVHIQALKLGTHAAISFH